MHGPARREVAELGDGGVLGGPLVEGAARAARRRHELQVVEHDVLDVVDVGRELHRVDDVVDLRRGVEAHEVQR